MGSMTSIGIEVPDLFDMQPGIKDLLVGSIKLVLQRMKREEIMPEDLEYRAMLASPERLETFIMQYKSRRDLAQDVALAPTGQTITDYDTPLVCGVTLGQVERMLVYTCVKKTYAAANIRPVPGPVRSYVAFAWQLPLIEAYRAILTPDHLDALGDALLALQTVNEIQATVRVDADDIAKAKEILGPRIADALRANPMALRSIARLDTPTFERIQQAASPREWDVFSADPYLVAELAKRDTERVNAIGPTAADLCVDTLRLLDNLPKWMFATFMDGFREHLEAHATALLGEDGELRDIFREIVADFGSMKEMPLLQIKQVTALKWNAIIKKVETRVDD